MTPVTRVIQMTIRRLFLALLLAAFVVTPAAKSEAGTTVERKEIAATFRTWEAAVSSFDTDGVMALYAPDFLQFGQDRATHRRLYEAGFRTLEAKRAGLKAEVALESVRFDRDRGAADVSLVIRREITIGESMRVARVRLLTRLERRDGRWLLCGTGSRTLCTVQVAWDGYRHQLVLTARSGDPMFPGQAVCSGRTLPAERILAASTEPAAGLKGVRARVLPARVPKAGDEIVFKVPYPGMEEEVRVPVPRPVMEMPTILVPERDFEIRRWPVIVRWSGVAARIPDFSRYDIHVRRATDGKLVLAIMSLPWDCRSVTLGATAEQRKVLGDDKVAYLVEVYALDMDGNFAVSQTRIYNLTTLDAD